MEIEELGNICNSAGLIMKSGQNTFKSIKLAFNPYLIKNQLYSQIGEIHKIWQKLIYLASKDNQLIQKTFQNVIKVDQMIENLFKIYKKSINKQQDDFLMFTRVDFFKNFKDQFKIIQYNLTSVSMASHSQNFNKVKKLTDLCSKRNHFYDYDYPQNIPAAKISQAVKQVYVKKNLQGLFLMLVSSSQKNICDQTYIQLKLLQKGIRSKRQSLCNLKFKIKIIDQKVYLQGQLISMVYYRTGYQPKDYCQNGNFQQCWKVRESLQLSNVIKIPNIKMQLMNQKRMQVQLSKFHVHQRYLNQQECNILRKSLVFTTDFQEVNQQINYFNYIQQKGIDKFILKPNLQGGGNNIYGKQVYQLLKNLSQQQKKKYILMQKIDTQPVQNIIFSDKIAYKMKCICEVSRYGILAQLNNQVFKNDCNGYLVRIKPENQNQGGVMAGVGAICSLAITK